MGFLDTVKGWLNIGGVKIKIEEMDPILYTGEHYVSGKFFLTAKNDKEVLSVTCSVIHEHSYKEDDEDQTDRNVVGEEKITEGFVLKAGETKEMEFLVGTHLDETIKDMGGVIGGVGKLASFASGKSDRYFAEVKVDVKGTVLDPSAEFALKVQPRPKM